MRRLFTFGGEDLGSWWRGIGVTFLSWTFEVELFRRALFNVWRPEFTRADRGWGYRFALNAGKLSLIFWLFTDKR